MRLGDRSDDNLHEYIDFKIAGSNLRITTTKSINNFKKLSVRVTYTDDFNMVIAKNETNVTALSDVDLTDITFKSYDFAKLYLNAKTKNFTLMANDKSKIELNLKSEKAIDISKNANVKALIASLR
jgi:alpha-D-ribose 1-methylphosphonate 5-triphosphate synthase subunit PhnI